MAFSRDAFGSPQQGAKHTGTLVGVGGGANGVVQQHAGSALVARELHSSGNVCVSTLLSHVRHVAGSHSLRHSLRHDTQNIFKRKYQKTHRWLLTLLRTVKSINPLRS